MNNFPFKRSRILASVFKTGIYLCIAVILAAFSGCYVTFYSTNTKPSIDSATVVQFNSSSKYYIVHFSNSVNGLEQVYVKQDSLFGQIKLLPLQHTANLYPDQHKSKNRAKDRKIALREVHLYTSLPVPENDSSLRVHLSSFNRVDAYELNRKATTRNHILSTAGIVVTVAAIALVIAAASLSTVY